MTTITPPRGPARSGAAPVPPAPTPARPPAAPAPPTEAVPALLGALAVLGGTLAIPPMVSGGEWFWYTAEVVAVIWLVGVGARLARAPAAVVVFLQLAAAAIAMTALFTVRGYGGVIPNGAVLTEAGDLLSGAWTQIRSTVSPAPSSTELSFLICLSVSVTALIVDMLIAWCRAPALVALPLLCLYAVPASIDVSMLPWSAFAVPAVLYAMLLVSTGLTGRQIGAGAGIAQVASGLVIGCVAAVVALIVADSVTGIGTTGRLPRTTNGTNSAIGLSPFTSLKGSLEQGTPVDLFRVSGLPGPAYLRNVGLQKWTPNEGWSVDELSPGPLPEQPIAVGQTQVSVTALGYQDQFLPIYNGVTALRGLDDGWSFDSALEAVHRSDKVTPSPYQVIATFGQPSADDLRTDTASAGGELLETGSLRPEVVAKAVEVTAGATTAFDKADRLRTWFTDPANGFVYSLQVPTGDSGDLLLDFLTLKQGYCEQYATAMAVMLRAIGVPARVAVGFTQGVPDGNGDYVINSHDAHAWVEVPFDNAGWVEFDPTPLGGGQGGQQGFTGGAGTTQSAPTTGAGVSSTPTPGEEELGAGRFPTAAATTGSDAAAGTTGSDGPAIPPGLWWVLGLAAGLGVALAGPTVVRRRRRDRRLATADAGGPDAADAAWREIEDLAVDHGIALDSAQSARACANRLAKTAHLTQIGREQLRGLVAAAERGWYDGSASAVTTAERLGDAPRTLAVELAHAAPLSLLDRLVPRSVRPAGFRG
jgi:transglutaminase-like putative cysteine protease